MEISKIILREDFSTKKILYFIYIANIVIYFTITVGLVKFCMQHCINYIMIISFLSYFIVITFCVNTGPTMNRFVI